MLPKEVPMIDPLIKLVPTINPIGKFIVLFTNKLTLLLLLLFWIPIINTKNKEELNKNENNIFLTNVTIF